MPLTLGFLALGKLRSEARTPPTQPPPVKGGGAKSNFTIALAAIRWLLLLLLLTACVPSQSNALVCPTAQPFARPETLRPAPPNWPPQPSNNEAALPADLASRLEATLDEIMQLSKATGVTAAVSVAGVGRWSAVRGMAALEPSRKVQAGDLFHAASIGKMFTAVLVWQQIEAGKLSLDTPIEAWFPDFPNAKIITIGHLLSHTSGIYTRPTRNAEGQPLVSQEIPDELIGEAAKQPLLFCPGANWSYSNTGYMMLGRILERLSNQTMPQLVAERIAQPLGLKNTLFLSPTNSSRLVAGHQKGVVVKGVNYTVPFAAGSIATTAEDLITFLHQLHSGKLLKLETLRRMGQRFYPMLGYSSQLFYGFGMMQFDSPVGVLLGHSGGITGFNSILWHSPSDGISVALIFNDDPSSAAGALRLHQAVLQWRK